MNGFPFIFASCCISFFLNPRPSFGESDLHGGRFKALFNFYFKICI